jgi:hypothetical protein
VSRRHAPCVGPHQLVPPAKARHREALALAPVSNRGADHRGREPPRAGMQGGRGWRSRTTRRISATDTCRTRRRSATSWRTRSRSRPRSRPSEHAASAGSRRSSPDPAGARGPTSASRRPCVVGSSNRSLTPTGVARRTTWSGRAGQRSHTCRSHQARRVLRPGGVLAAAAISRFVSLLDGLVNGWLGAPSFDAIVERDLADGQHRNPTNRARIWGA